MPYQLGQPWTPVYKDNPLLRAAVEAQSRDNSRAMMTGQRPQGSIAAPKKTLGSVLHNALSGAVEPVLGKRMGQKLADLIDYTPVAAATEADEAGQAARSGNYLGAAGHGLGALLSALPDGGALAAKAGGALAGKGAILHSIIAPLFHGSPHKFDKFALEKIGTGEGAQAYGHGLYFAENPEVARMYRSQLAGLPTHSIGGVPQPLPGTINDFRAALESKIGGPIPSALKGIENDAAVSLQRHGPSLAGKKLLSAYSDITDPALRNVVDHAAALTGTVQEHAPGHLYQVKLDANPEDFLDWDKPLNAQSPNVQQAFHEIPYFQKAAQRQNSEVDHIYSELSGGGSRPSNATLPAWEGSMAYRTLGGMPLPVGNPYLGMNDGPKSAAMLKDLGVQGISYLDQGSRGAGQGTRNYVVFDPNIIDITGRY